MIATLLLVGALVACALALLTALLFFRNVSIYLAPTDFRAVRGSEDLARVSVLVPARNEEQSIEECVNAALASRDVELEVIVLDDHSSDRTATLVNELSKRDPRVRVVTAPDLPAGWCGKQHACHVLSGLARHPLLLFTDADVRLKPEGLLGIAAFKRSSSAALISGVPRQITETFFEKLLIPLIHFLLLDFLPIDRMRRSTLPAFGAGCGQLFMTDRSSYNLAGGHATIRASLHDGLTLPRAYRRAGLMTDLFDATPVASCRMYRSAREVWNGLSKNATEGIASPAAIGPWTILLIVGQIMPALIVLRLLVAGGVNSVTLAAGIVAAVGWCASLAVRIAAAKRFQQSMSAAFLHPFAIVVLLVIQWWALIRQTVGSPASWKGRAYNSYASAAPTGD